MQKGQRNKMMTGSEKGAKQKSPKGELTEYSFPDLGVTVEAHSREEAEKLAKEKANKIDNK